MWKHKSYLEKDFSDHLVGQGKNSTTLNKLGQKFGPYIWLGMIFGQTKFFPWRINFLLQKWKIKNPTLRIVRISAKSFLWEKNSCFDSVLVILTSRDLVHTFELGLREFQSYDCEFKSDWNILSNLLEIVVTNRIRKVFVVHSQVHNSKKGDHAPR